MKYSLLCILLLSSFSSAQAPQFSVEQTKSCSDFAGQVATFNEMRKDGLPLEAAKKMLPKVNSVADFKIANVEEIYNLKESNSNILYGYYEVSCYNKIANKVSPSLKEIRQQLTVCEKRASAEQVVDCTVEKTVELTFNINRK